VIKVYKLTESDWKTYGDTMWGPGVTHTVPAEKRLHSFYTSSPVLCSKNVIHAYTNPNLGLLLNTGHADFVHPILWAAETPEIVKKDWGKIGCYELTTVSKMPTPEWYADEKQRNKVSVLFAVLCTAAVSPKSTHGSVAKLLSYVRSFLSTGNKDILGLNIMEPSIYESMNAANETVKAAQIAAEGGNTWRVSRMAFSAVLWTSYGADDIDFAGLADQAVVEIIC